MAIARHPIVPPPPVEKSDRLGWGQLLRAIPNTARERSDDTLYQPPRSIADAMRDHAAELAELEQHRSKLGLEESAVTERKHRIEECERTLATFAQEIRDMLDAAGVRL